MMCFVVMCFSFFWLRPVSSVLNDVESLDCPFLIVPSDFSDVYLQNATFKIEQQKPHKETQVFRKGELFLIH